MADVTATARLDPELLVYGISMPLDPQLSPDGTRILYRLLTADREADAARSRLVTCAWDGSDARPLTGAGHLDAIGRWSPDGHSVAFVSQREDGHAVLVVDAGGGEPRELARHRRPVAGLAWAPDGARLAYTCAFDPANPSEAQEGPQGPVVRVVGRDDYRLDGVGFIGEARSQVFVVDVAGGGRRQLTSGGTDFASPRWSPDGRTIAAAAGPYYRARLALVDAGTGGVRLVGPEGGQVTQWAWSPSGDGIALAADPGRTYQADLYLHDVGSGETVRLTDDPGIQPHVTALPVPQPVSMPVWLDGRRLAFCGARAGATGLYSLDCETGEVELLHGWPATDHGFSADRDRRRFVFAQTTLERPSELVTLQLDSGEAATVTACSAAALAERPAARWERLDVVRDGVTVEAWLLKPPDFDPGRRYPLVLDVHGGPNSVYGYGFLPVQQCLASHGFLVVFANPRGSATYGREFAGRVFGDWGGGDFQDLMAVVDTVVERPYVDGDRLGIYGYSYGGYMTSWSIGRTDRFRAAVCGAPCFDLASHWGTSDIGHAWDEVQWGGPPHERADWFRERSPSTLAHRTRTPTLIIQGDADDRCPVGQAQHMFTTLRRVGCEVELALYPGASHLFFAAPETRPSQREDYLRRVLEWFRDHL
jgi:dipeptidyl aminopeptidase/acylaminoacyl peptidase